jgi:hypothetical protein
LTFFRFQILCGPHNADNGRRYYSTIREGGAESLLGLTETAGLPKYHSYFSPGFSVSEARLRWTRERFEQKVKENVREISLTQISFRTEKQRVEKGA